MHPSESSSCVSAMDHHQFDQRPERFPYFTRQYSPPVQPDVKGPSRTEASSGHPKEVTAIDRIPPHHPTERKSLHIALTGDGCVKQKNIYGPLKDQIEKIKNSNTDPRARKPTVGFVFEFCPNIVQRHPHESVLETNS